MYASQPQGFAAPGRCLAGGDRGHATAHAPRGPMTSPQPALEDAESPDYGGQLDRDALKTATLSGARWVGMSRIAAEALALATTVLLARLISPAEYGIAVIVLILPMLATILTYEGFGAFLIQTRTCTREHVGSAVLLSIASGLLLTILVFFLAPLVAEPIFGPGTSDLAQLCAPIFLIASFGSVPRALLQRRLDWRWMNLTEIVQLIVVSVASLALAFAGLGSTALILGAVIGAVAVTAVLLAVAPGGLPRWDGACVRSIVRFGAPAAVAGFSATLERNVTFLVLGGHVSSAQVGLFWRAYQLGVEYQSKIANNITFRVAKPVLTRAERIEDLREIRTRLLRVNTTLIFPLLALLIVLAPDVVPWIYGSDWTGAVAPTQVLAVAGMWAILLAGIDAPLMAVGRPGALAMFHIAMVIGAGATAWFTAPMGITAVAVGMAACQLLLLLAGQYFLLQRVIGVPMRESLGDGAAALVCSGVLVLATLPLAEVLRGSLEPLPLTLLIGCLGLAVYGVCLRTISASAWRDLCTLFGRVLGLRRVLPALRKAPQRV
jgi:O-antigen/teichoic acid export membrane protein